MIYWLKLYNTLFITIHIFIHTQLLMLRILKLLVKHPSSKFFMTPLEIIESVNKPREVSLSLKLFLQPVSFQPISSVRIILSWSAADINHLLHLCTHVLLHFQCIINSGPVINLLPWLNRIVPKEVVILSSSHPQVLNELYGMASLLICMFPEHVCYLR